MKLGLAARILIPVMALFAVGIMGLATYVSSVARRNVIDASIANGKQTIGQFKALRKYYTDNVTSKIAKSGALKISFDHKSRADTVPLPATMIQDLSSSFEGDPSGIKLRLYSAYPFPNRKDRALDQFESDSLRYLASAPNATFVRVETVGGRESVRIAIADKMTIQSCVNCHNAHPDSPKRDWKLGETRGALEVIAPIQAELEAESRMTQAVFGIALGCFAMVGGFLWWFLQRRVVSAISQESERLASAARETELSASAMLRASQSLAQGASQQAASIEETSATSLEILTLASNNAANAGSGARAMSRVNLQVKQANGALEAMSASILEIDRSSQKISKIIKTIDGIAFQTNILALNAAVEAARAGENGLGFAVVADEVRALAQRSAEAAKETSDLIQESVGRAGAGSRSLAQLTEVIQVITGDAAEVDQLIAQVSTSSQEQRTGMQNISHSLENMQQTTSETAAQSEETAAAAVELTSQADVLRRSVLELSALIRGQRSAIRQSPARQEKRR